MPECDHSGLKKYGTRERRELLLKGKTVKCPDCGTPFEAQRDHYQGDIYLIKQEAA